MSLVSVDTGMDGKLLKFRFWVNCPFKHVSCSSDVPASWFFIMAQGFPTIFPQWSQEVSTEKSYNVRCSYVNIFSTIIGPKWTSLFRCRLKILQESVAQRRRAEYLSVRPPLSISILWGLMHSPMCIIFIRDELWTKVSKLLAQQFPCHGRCSQHWFV